MRSRSLHHSGDWNKFLCSTRKSRLVPARRRVALTLKAARTLRMTQAPEAAARSRAQISERTFRKDKWWQTPRIVAAGLTIWVLYATVRVFTGHWYFVPQYHYLTPFYSPCVSGECVPGSSTLGQWIPAVPPIIPYAFVSLVFVLGFLLTYDVAQAFRGPDGNFGFGIGSLILLANVIFIWGYTLGCHTCRHITAGRLKNFSKHPVRYWAWTKVSWLNTRHLQFAWISLGTLMLSDLYILLLASGAFSDPRIFN